MAPALAEGLVAPAAMVVWGLATTGLLLLLLLLLCSFFHRVNRSFATQEIKANHGVKVAKLSSSNKEAALQGGTPSPGEPQQQVDGPAALKEPENLPVGDRRVQGPGWTPHSHTESNSSLRTPEFLRHRQLPVLPGDAGTATAAPVPDTEGRIYESIRYKPGMLKKTWDDSSTQEDFPPLPVSEEPSSFMKELLPQEEVGSQESPGPVYARVCKPPREAQPQQPASPPEPQEEAPPTLPEKHFDVA